MKSLFDGLYAYELIMVSLGVVLFFVLIAALLIFVTRGQQIVSLLLFFGFPVVMIGYPGIQSFEISESVLKINTYTDRLKQNPADAAAREALGAAVAKVASRPLQAPAANAAIARAQMILGEEQQADARADKALKADPGLQAARDVKEQITLDRNLVALASRVEKDPQDAGAKAELAAASNKVDQFRLISPTVMMHAARAKKILGDQQKAREYEAGAVAINPMLMKGVVQPTLPHIASAPQAPPAK